MKYVLALALFCVGQTVIVFTTNAQEKTATVTFSGSAAGLAVYTTSELPVVLKYSITRPEGEWKKPSCRVEIRDFWGAARDGAQTQVQVNGARLDITTTWTKAGPGWYCLDLGVTDTNGVWKVSREVDDRMGRKNLPQFLLPMFAVVPEPRSVQEVPDCPVGVDTLATSSYEEVSDAKQVELAYRLGVRRVRERIAWGWIERTPGQYDWDGSSLAGNQRHHGKRALAITDAFHAHGIQVLEVFHGAPKWAVPVGSDPGKTFPEDLRSFHRWLGDMGNQFAASVQAWTIWNEQDIGFFCAEPPDRYAALVKTAALALRQTKNKPLVLLGSFARDPRVGQYDRVLFANNVAPYVDVYDFHTYAPIGSGAFDKVLDTHRAIAEGQKLDDIWLTETAFAYSQDAPSTIVANRQTQVRYLIEAYTKAFARGIRAAYWHALRPAAPFAANQFGMLNGNLEPFPVYQAMAVMASTLGRGHYLGSITTAQGTPVQLYQDGSTEVAVVFATGSETTLGVLPREARCVDVMGETLAVKSTDGGSIVASHGWPFYIRGTAWKAQLKSVRKEVAAAPRQELPSALVLRANYPKEMLAIDSGKSELNWDGVASNWAPRGYGCAANQKVEVAVEVYNFSSVPVTGTLMASLPAGTVSEPKVAAYTVEPGDRVLQKFTLTVNAGGLFTFEARDAKGMRQDVTASLWEIRK